MPKFRVDREAVHMEFQEVDGKMVLFIEAKSLQAGGTSWYRFWVPEDKTFADICEDL